MPEDNTNIQGNSNKKGKVIIMKEAFRNMVTHVLRFGSKVLDKNVEVMGICIGKLSENQEDLVLINSIPLFHGVKVSSGFSKEDFILFSDLEKQYQKKSLNLIGWYSSHPGWGLYFSDLAKKTHQFFQKESNPYGFHIVFDHTLMGKEKNYGLEIYRFDDYKSPDKYHIVEYEIEIPKTLEYFKWVQKFVEDFQKESPILIKEIKEMKENIPGDLKEIPTLEEIPSVEKVDESLDASPLILGYQEGISKFSQSIIESFNNQFNKWFNDTLQGTSKGTETLSNSINKINEKMSQGMSKVENWFIKYFDNVLNDFKDNIFNYIDKRTNAQKNLTDDFLSIKNILIDELNKIYKTNLTNFESEIKIKIESLTEKLNDSFKLNTKLEEITQSESKVISDIQEEIKDLPQKIDKHFKDSISQFENDINEKMEKMNSELQPFKESFTEIKNLLEKLQKVITELRNI